MTSHKIVLAGLLCLLQGSCGIEGAGATKRFDSSAVRLTSKPVLAKRIVAKVSGIDATAFTFSASASYRVTDRNCVAIDQSAAIGGLQLLPEYTLDLPLRKERQGELTIPTFLDALQSDDYFGKGVCNWALESVSLRFSNGTTNFVSILSRDEIDAGGPVETFFLQRDLTEKPSVGDTVFGEAKDFYLANQGAQFVMLMQSLND